MPSCMHANAQTTSVWDNDHIHLAIALAERETARWARRRSLNRADREDLRQEILLAVLERSPRFNPASATWAGFVTMLARHAAIDWLGAERRRRALATHAIDEVPEADVLVDEAAGSKSSTSAELRIEIETLLREAPPAASRALRQIIAACGDIAAAQRASGDAKSPFYRAVAELRFWLRASGLGIPSRCLGKNVRVER